MEHWKTVHKIHNQFANQYNRSLVAKTLSAISSEFFSSFKSSRMTTLGNIMKSDGKMNMAKPNNAYKMCDRYMFMRIVRS